MFTLTPSGERNRIREHTSVPLFTHPTQKQYGSRRNPLPIAIDE